MLTVGQTIARRGNFTMLGYVDQLDRAGLERSLGFHAGRLDDGYAILVIAPGQVILPRDLELQGSTRWSGGFSKNVPGQGLASLESVLTARGQDPQQLKRKVCEFFARGGKQTPAKVVPVMEHTDGMSYPDAEALAPGVRSGVPQFNLLQPRLFRVIKVVS